jgi:flagellar basal-body rod modification protein FlgD
MIDTVSYLNSITSASPGAKQVEAGGELGKDAFMQLLINQLSHQDPLEPMDNTQFISQLAQFSSLEQMQNVASAVQMLALSQAASTNSQMVSLIGKRVIVPGAAFSLDGTGNKPVDLKYNLDSETIPASMIITNEKGDVVRKLEIKNPVQGMNSIQFDGKDENGNLLEPGNYTYRIVDYQDKSIPGVTTYSNYLVDAVAFNGSDTILKSKGATINVSDITEVINN